MSKHTVAVGKYEKPFDSVRQVVELAGGFKDMPKGAKVVIKPNIVFWTAAVPFPKFGALTHEPVDGRHLCLLKDAGASEITIVEGSVTRNPKEMESSAADAFEKLGYNELGRRYGVKPIRRSPAPLSKGTWATALFSSSTPIFLIADYVVDIPVMKTHAQTGNSLGIKNLKGTIDIPSRRACHSADPVKDLHFWVAPAFRCHAPGV